MKTVAMILAGGAGTRLDILSKHRAKPAVPFGGKYRVIDFVLSNCVNSGIYFVAVLTQYLPRSLNEHIGIGRSWDLDRKLGGVELLAPYQGKEGDWYGGTADAIYKNMTFFTDKKADSVLILSGDHIYKMNYQDMIRQHELTGADMTIGVNPVDIEIASEFGILSADDAGKLIEFEEKPKKPKSNLASMGIYVFKAEFLKNILLDFCGKKGVKDFGKDLIPALMKTSSIYTYKFQGYWRDVGTLEEYWKSNMELLEKNPPVDFYEDELPIFTKHAEVPPAKFGANAVALNSLVSGGCMIDGKVEHSVLCSEVIIEEGAIVRDSIILNKTVVKKGTVIHRAIIDKEVVIGEKCVIGTGEDYKANKEKPKNVYTGLNLIGKFAHIPDNIVIERNCRIMSRVNASDFKGNVVKSGDTVHSKSEEDKFSQHR